MVTGQTVQETRSKDGRMKEKLLNEYELMKITTKGVIDLGIFSEEDIKKDVKQHERVFNENLKEMNKSSSFM